MGFSNVSKGVFKNSESFSAHLVSRRAKAFAPESAKAVVLTPHPLRDKVHGIVKLFPPSSRLRSTSDMSIFPDPEEESSFRDALFPTLPFLTLLPLPGSQESCPCLADSPLQNAL